MKCNRKVRRFLSFVLIAVFIIFQTGFLPCLKTLADVGIPSNNLLRIVNTSSLTNLPLNGVLIISLNKEIKSLSSTYVPLIQRTDTMGYPLDDAVGLPYQQVDEDTIWFDLSGVTKLYVKSDSSYRVFIPPLFIKTALNEELAPEDRTLSIQTRASLTQADMDNFIRQTTTMPRTNLSQSVGKMEILFNEPIIPHSMANAKEPDLLYITACALIPLGLWKLLPKTAPWVMSDVVDSSDQPPDGASGDDDDSLKLPEFSDKEGWEKFWKEFEASQAQGDNSTAIERVKEILRLYKEGKIPYLPTNMPIPENLSEADKERLTMYFSMTLYNEYREYEKFNESILANKQDVVFMRELLAERLEKKYARLLAYAKAFGSVAEVENALKPVISDVIQNQLQYKSFFEYLMGRRETWNLSLEQAKLWESACTEGTEYGKNFIDAQATKILVGIYSAYPESVPLPPEAQNIIDEGYALINRGVDSEFCKDILRVLFNAIADKPDEYLNTDGTLNKTAFAKYLATESLQEFSPEEIAKMNKLLARKELLLQSAKIYMECKKTDRVLGEAYLDLLAEADINKLKSNPSDDTGSGPYGIIPSLVGIGTNIGIAGFSQLTGVPFTQIIFGVEFAQAVGLLPPIETNWTIEKKDENGNWKPYLGSNDWLIPYLVHRDKAMTIGNKLTINFGDVLPEGEYRLSIPSGELCDSGGTPLPQIIEEFSVSNASSSSYINSPSITELGGGLVSYSGQLCYRDPLTKELLPVSRDPITGKLVYYGYNWSIQGYGMVEVPSSQYLNPSSVEMLQQLSNLDRLLWNLQNPLSTGYNSSSSPSVPSAWSPFTGSSIGGISGFEITRQLALFPIYGIGAFGITSTVNPAPRITKFNITDENGNDLPKSKPNSSYLQAYHGQSLMVYVSAEDNECIQSIQLKIENLTMQAWAAVGQIWGGSTPSNETVDLWTCGNSNSVTIYPYSWLTGINTPDATYRLKVIATDTAGYKTESEPILVTRGNDTTGPKIEVLNWQSGSSFPLDKKEPINLRITDEKSGIKEYRIMVRKDDFPVINPFMFLQVPGFTDCYTSEGFTNLIQPQKVNDEKASITPSIPWSPVTSGYYSIKVIASDKAGNEKEVLLLGIDRSIDKESPNVQITSPVRSSFPTGQEITVSANASDDTCLEEVTLKANPNWTMQLKPVTFTWKRNPNMKQYQLNCSLKIPAISDVTYWLLSKVGPLKYTIEIFAKDINGKTARKTKEVSIELDDGDPVINIFQYTNQVTKGEMIVVHATIKEKNLKRVGIKPAGWHQKSMIPDTYTFYIPTSGLNAKTYKIEVFAEDTCGHKSTKNCQVTVKLPPVPSQGNAQWPNAVWDSTGKKGSCFVGALNGAKPIVSGSTGYAYGGNINQTDGGSNTKYGYNGTTASPYSNSNWGYSYQNSGTYFGEPQPTDKPSGTYTPNTGAASSGASGYYSEQINYTVGPNNEITSVTYQQQWNYGDGNYGYSTGYYQVSSGNQAGNNPQNGDAANLPTYTLITPDGEYVAGTPLQASVSSSSMPSDLTVSNSPYWYPQDYTPPTPVYADPHQPTSSRMKSEPIMNSSPEFAYIPNQTVTKGKSVSFKVSATDIDGNALTYTMSGPTNATFKYNTGAKSYVFNWTPKKIGNYEVTFKASDGKSTTVLKINITVKT